MLKVALGIALGGLLFILLAGIIVALLAPSSGPDSISGSESLRAPITTAQYDSIEIGAATREQVVADFGEPLAACTAAHCEGPGTAYGGQYIKVIGVDVPVGHQYIYYNNGDTESLFTLRFDRTSGKLWTKSTS